MSDLDNKVNPLAWNVPITNKDGTPTNEFMRKWAQQASTNGAIPDLTTAAGVSAVLDKLGLAQGDILYRDAAQWKVLAPGTLGYVLQTEGAGANPAWAGISALLDLLGATQGEILYRNGTVWTVLAPGTNGQLLTYNSTTHAPEWDSFSGVLLGVGAPTMLEPAGVLYSQTDTAAVWSSQPTNAANPTVVHFGSTSGNASAVGAVTISGAPTVGNLLIAFVGTNNDIAANIAAGWTSFENGSGGGTVRYGRALYRYAQVGDTATLPAIGSGGSFFWFAEVYEISGVTGVFATDVAAHSGVYGQSSSPFNTGANVTTANNQLVLLGAGDYDASSTNITNPAGWTNDIQQLNNGNYGAWLGSHRAFAVIGTSYQASIAFETGSLHVCFAIQVLIANTSALVANWVLVGPQTLPTGANPTATAGPAAVNGSAATYMRSDGAPAVQKASAAQFGIVEVDGTTITAAAGVISAVQPAGANPTATAGPAAVNGSATTFMRSDGAPAVQKASAAQFGIVEVDGTTITAAAGVISAVQPAGANPTATAGLVAVNGSAATFMRSDGAPAVDFSSINPNYACLLATTAAADTSSLTYSNGASGVGATLTGTVNTAITFDGTALVLNNRVLVKNDTQSPSGAFNGAYILTQLQTSLLPPILTRAPNFNSAANIGYAAPIFVRNGTANAKTAWIVGVSAGVVVGTTNLSFTQATSLVTGANPTATAGPAAVNGSAATYMRSDGAPAVQKASAAQFGIVEVDGTTITAAAGVISAVQPAGANPTATAGPAAVNGSAATYMRSDGAPAVQKASAAQFGIVEVDGTTITAAAGVISAVQPAGANPTATASDVAVNGAATTYMRSDGAPAIQKCSSSVFGLAKVDNVGITASGGVVSLGTPTASTLGGIESLAAVTSKWINTISTAGVPSATQPATTDLSDAATGAWTPTDASGAGLTFLSGTVGHYIKIGKKCYIFGIVEMPATASALQMQVGSLPFTVSSLGVNGFPLPVDATGAGISCFWFFILSTTTAGLGNYTTGGAVTNAAVSGDNIYFACEYPTT